MRQSDIDSQQARTGRDWKRVLVPALRQPYSQRALDVAFRLAKGTGATVLLAFVVEVPRILPLEAAMPETEADAAFALRDAQDIGTAYKVPVEAFIHRTRSAREGILKLITLEKVDLLMVGARFDGLRGLPRELVRDLFDSAPCEVVLDFVPGEKEASA